MLPPKRIPKGCPECNNPRLDLDVLMLRCLKCGWSRNLEILNQYLEDEAHFRSLTKTQQKRCPRCGWDQTRRRT